MLTRQTLFDRSGNRKYLVARERHSFVCAAIDEDGPVATFCLTLAITGARISEVLALTEDRLDWNDIAIVIETLKQRKKGVYRAVPVPHELMQRLKSAHLSSGSLDNSVLQRRRLWPWGRTTAWKHVKRVMARAGIREPFNKPKALRHGFGVEAGQNGIQLHMVQRWMGHARIETTAIYSEALGDEERGLARRTWKKLDESMRASPSQHRQKVGQRPLKG